MTPAPESGPHRPPEIDSHYAGGSNSAGWRAGPGGSNSPGRGRSSGGTCRPRRLEADPAVLGASAHLLAVARK